MLEAENPGRDHRAHLVDLAADNRHHHRHRRRHIASIAYYRADPVPFVPEEVSLKASLVPPVEHRQTRQAQ